MKKIIKIILLIMFLFVVCLAAVLIFNPFDLRNKIISSVVNNYLQDNLKNYQPANSNEDANSSAASIVDNPLLSDQQEKMLTDIGVDVSKLPTEVTPEMQACAVEKLGEVRVLEIVNGATPSVMEVLKAKECLGE